MNVESKQDKEKLIKVPARSEIFAAVAVNRDGTGIISKFDLSEGIFMADSLVMAENNQANVAIINSLEEDVYLDIPILKLEYYDERVNDSECVAQTAEMFNVNFCNREARLNEKLDFSNLNESEVQLLNPLINEFSDVLFLEGDMLSNKTLFEYETKLKDNAKIVNQKQYNEFKKLPQDCKNSHAFYIKNMTQILAGLIGVKFLAFLDDLIIWSDSLKSNIEHLGEDFKCLQKNQIKLQPDKAHLLCKKIVLLFGMPRVLLSNQGQNFMSKLFKNICKLFKIKRLRTSAFWPQSNGAIVESQRALKEHVRHFIDKNQTCCDELFKFAAFALNISVSSVTKFTPYELLFGRKLVLQE